MNKFGILLILQIFLIAGIVNSLSVDTVTVDSVSPGEESTIRINVENDGNRDVEQLSFNLVFPNDSGIIPVGSSQAFLDNLEEDEDEIFAFRFKIANNLPPGTYSLAYVITYEEDGDDKEQRGTIGVVVSAEPEIDVIADAQNPVIGQQSSLNVRVVNKGLADARFVSLSIESDDLTILSENSEYIGTIDSDDFETSSFDLIYNNKFSLLSVIVTYKDFDNNDIEIRKSIPIRVYTQQEAVEKGILKKSNAPTYAGIILLLLVVWFVYRFIRKRKKNKL